MGVVGPYLPQPIIEGLWVLAGGSVAHAKFAAAVSKAESGWGINSFNNDSNGTQDRGLWQINTVNGHLSVFQPLRNARSAVILSKNGSDWTPWTTYNNGDAQRIYDTLPTVAPNPKGARKWKNYEGKGGGGGSGGGGGGTTTTSWWTYLDPFHWADIIIHTVEGSVGAVVIDALKWLLGAVEVVFGIALVVIGAIIVAMTLTQYATNMPGAGIAMRAAGGGASIVTTGAAALKGLVKP